MSKSTPFKIVNDDSDTVVVISATKVTLKEAQDFVDGYVQLVTLRDGSQVLMNEGSRGRAGIKLKPNLAATAMLKPEEVRMSAEGILGNVLILRNGCRWT
jgi:hypothetical protein